MTMHGGALGAAEFSHDHLWTQPDLRDEKILVRELRNCWTNFGEVRLAHWLSHTRSEALSTYQHLLKSVSPAVFMPPITTHIYLVMVQLLSQNKRMYRTRSGYFGLGPSILKNGDMAVVLLGGRLHLYFGRMVRIGISLGRPIYITQI